MVGIELQRTARFYVLAVSGTSSAVQWPKSSAAPVTNQQRAVEIEAGLEEGMQKKGPTSAKSEANPPAMSPSSGVPGAICPEEEHSLLDALSSGPDAELDGSESCSVLYLEGKVSPAESANSHRLQISAPYPLLELLHLEDCWPCVGGLSAVNAIGTQLRDHINSGLTRWRLTVRVDAIAESGKNPIANTWELAEGLGYPHTDLVGALISLEAEDMVKSQLLQTTYFIVSSEGQGVIDKGSPEMRVLESVPVGSQGISKADLEAALGSDLVKIGLGQCMKNKWVSKGEGGSIVRGAHLEGSVQDNVRELLRKVAAGEKLGEQQTKDLKRRKLISQVTRKSFKVTRGPTYAPKRVRRQAELTKEMLASGSWKDSTFKEYNFKALGVPCGGGNLHPLLKVRAEFRKILMYMGFEEMPTNRWVETSFWNFDSLFQPQSHPARDAHDTFFIKDPASALSFPEDYLEVVKDTHETGGGFGSVGYGCQWKREEASKNLLRTHTTAVSSQMLYRLANQESGFTPKRYFSIDRVFRNETMDATHLCEFHQVEGLVADRNLCLGDLIGVIKTFFHKIGIKQIRFKPAYNPYTEPSMEIFGYHPDLKKWTEIGNSGMFRPEMLLPMGLPKDVRVIAWGLSLERPTMIKYGITNIRELFGHKADLNRTKTAPVCRFE